MPDLDQIKQGKQETRAPARGLSSAGRATPPTRLRGCRDQVGHREDGMAAASCSTPRSRPASSEAWRMKLSEKVKIALDETRILILGAQILLGFGFRGVFSERFDELP